MSTPAPLVASPTILHSSEGLTIHVNPKNEFCVVTLYYWANPAKRSEEWVREAKAGLSEAKFRQEYLIDYEAMYGEKVFPEIIAHRQSIVIEEPNWPTFPPDQVYWGGFDYGLRNPSSFHVYTRFDGVTYSVWELFEQCKNIKDFCAKLKACPYWSRIKYIAADPSIWSLRGFKADGTPCGLDYQFWEQGIHKFIKGSQDEAAWLATMHKHWADPASPTFRILSCCPNQIRELSGAVYASMSDQAMATSNYRETLVDHNNHSLDDLKYYMNSQPSSRQEHTKFKDPIMVNRWCK